MVEQLTMDDLDAVLTPGEVSSILRVSEVTVRRLIRTGYLPRLAGVRVTLIPRWAVDSYLRGAYHADSDGQGEGPGGPFRPKNHAP